MDEIKFNAELIDLLENIRIKPGMYLGCASITRLRLFIIGFEYASYIFNDKKYQFKFFPGFQKWVQDYYDIGKTPLGWDNLILKANSNDEEKALFDFFDLFDRYRSKVNE